MNREEIMKLRTIMAIAASTFVLAACETSSNVMSYQASTQNVITAQSILRDAGATVSVGSFTAADSVQKPMCRMDGRLDIAPGVDIQTYVRNALQTELFATGAYGERGTVITGHVESIDVKTFGAGMWTMVLTVRSSADPQGYTVTGTQPYSSSFSAYQACQNAVAAFNPAVQALLSEVISHPGFPALAGAAR